MANVGFATLSVIPSFAGFQSKLSAGVAGPLAQAGRDGGRRFGDVAGKEAGGRFKSGFGASVKGFAAPMAGLLAGAGIANFFGDAFAEAKEAGEVSRVTAKLIESTGHAANLTSTQMGDLAQKMMDYAAVDDEMVQSGANVMLTFRNVRNEIGAGNDVFDRSIKAALDLSTVMGTDLNSSALQLGKALNDPIKGVTALGRAGVQFTEGQKSRIKALVEGGDLLAAQRVILEEVEHQIGGAAGAAADGTDRLAVAMGNLKEAVGEQLMPTIEGFSNWMVDDGIPALTTAGGVAKDAASAFGSLPKPVQDTALAFAALKIASKFGFDPAAPANAMRQSYQRLRDEMALQQALANGITGGYQRLGDEAVTTSGKLSRFQTASALTSRSFSMLRNAGSNLLGMFGGPWGLAFVGAAAVVTKLWRAHQEAKKRVDDMTAALDKQTGALTENNREIAFKNLQESGAVDLAKKWGIALDDLTSAALGNADAQARVNAQMDSYFQASKPTQDVNQANAQGYATLNTEAGKLRGVIGQGSAEIQKSREAFRNHAEAMGQNVDAMQGAGQATQSYADKLRSAREAVQKLIDAEQKRRDAAVANKRDQVALQQAMADAREEARKGEKTLNQSTQAGRDNWNALLDLSDQWNQSSAKVRNARGAYKDMRKTFIEVATEMTGSSTKAEKLANQFLKLPRRKQIHVDTPGMDKALADMRRLRWLAEAPGRATLEVKLKGPSYAGLEPRLNGGRVNAGQPYLVGERRPEVFVPDRAGRIEKDAGKFGSGGVNINIDKVFASSGGSFMDEMRSRAEAAVGGGRRR